MDSGWPRTSCRTKKVGANGNEGGVGERSARSETIDLADLDEGRRRTRRTVSELKRLVWHPYATRGRRRSIARDIAVFAFVAVSVSLLFKGSVPGTLAIAIAIGLVEPAFGSVVDEARRRWRKPEKDDA